MKKTIATALIALTTLAGAASAMTSSALEASLAQYPVNVDVSTLSQAQIDQLALVVHSGDSTSEIVSGIYSIVN